MSNPKRLKRKDLEQRQASLAEVRPVGVSDSALARIIGSLKERPELLEIAASSVNTTRRELVDHAARTLDSISIQVDLPLVAGGNMQWTIASPYLLLKHFLEHCPTYRDMFLRTTSATIAAHLPLQLILYHDEFTPGQILKPDNQRKTNSYYFTFLQFGECIRSEYAWLPCAELRHTVATLVDGGISAATRMVLRSFFCDLNNFTTGVVLPLPAAPTMVFAKLLCLIADESGIKYTWCVKGASGLLPCLKCKNVVLADHSILENDSEGYFVDVAAISGFDATLDSDVWEKFDKLAALKAAGANKTKMEQMEKVFGLNLVLSGLLGDQELRAHIQPITHTAYDSMHCFFSNGIVGQEMHLLLRLCNVHLGITYSHIRDYCRAGWKTLKHCMNHVSDDVFSVRREKTSADGFKAIASELLAVFPFVTHFIETVVRPRAPQELQAAIDSFAMLSKAVAMLSVMKRRQDSISQETCASFKNVLAKHLHLFQKAHGKAEVRPKHHLSQHLPDQILQHGFVIDCWPCERKHKTLKRIAGLIENTRSYEKSLLIRAVLDQVAHTPCDTFSTMLVGETTPGPDLAETFGAANVVLGNSVRFGAVRLSSSDVVISEGKAMRILACMQVDAQFCLLVMLYTLVRHVGAGALWKPTNQTACVTLVANGFCVPYYWNFQPDSQMITLHDE